MKIGHDYHPSPSPSLAFTTHFRVQDVSDGKYELTCRAITYPVLRRTPHFEEKKTLLEVIPGVEKEWPLAMYF